MSQNYRTPPRIGLNLLLFFAAGSLLRADIVNGSVSPATSPVQYTFAANAGDNFEADLNLGSSFELTLYDALDNLVAVASANGPGGNSAVITWTALNSGTYTNRCRRTKLCVG